MQPKARFGRYPVKVFEDMTPSKYAFYRVHARVVVLLGILAATALLWFFVSGNTVALLNAMAISLAVALFGFALRQTPYEPFSPATLFGIATLHGVVGQTLLLTLTNREHPVDYLLAGYSREILFPGLVVIGLGIVAFMLGSKLPLKPISLQKVRILNDNAVHPTRLTFVMVGLGLVAAVATFLYVERLGVSVQALFTGSLGKRGLELEGADFFRYSSLAYYRLAAQLVSFGFLFVWSVLAASKRPLRSKLGAASGILFLLALIDPVLNSSRGPLVTTVVAATLIWWFFRSRISRRALLISALSVLLIVVVMGVMRASNRGNEHAFEGGFGAGLVDSTIGIRNGFGAGKTSVLVAGVPERLDHQKGATLITWVFGPVPRTLWVDKPSLRIGPVTGEALFGTRPPSGVPPGIVGEMYLNFGAPGVFVGMLLYGAAGRLLQTSFQPLLGVGRNGTLIYVMLLVMWFLLLPGSDVSGAVIRSGTMLLSLTAIFVITQRGSLGATPPRAARAVRAS